MRWPMPWRLPQGPRVTHGATAAAGASWLPSARLSLREFRKWRRRERCAPRQCRAVAGRVFRQAAAQKMDNGNRHAPGKGTPVGLGANHGCQGVRNCFSRECGLARQHLVVYGAEGPNIRGRSTFFPRACSGLIYAAVPRRTPACVAAWLSVGEVDMSVALKSSSRAFASPKSRTFAAPFGVIFTLAGFRSRWMMPRSCAYSSASAICFATGSASSRGTGPFAIRSARSAHRRTP
jgi:hypothetical protein